MNEENVSVKISMPLVDDIELQTIDTFYNDIVSEYTKTFVKEKDQVIAQRVMMNLQQENKQLKDNWNMLKEHLTNRYNNGTESISYRQVFIEIREAMQVLEIQQELEKGGSNE